MGWAVAVMTVLIGSQKPFQAGNHKAASVDGGIGWRRSETDWYVVCPFSQVILTPYESDTWLHSWLIGHHLTVYLSLLFISPLYLSPIWSLYLSPTAAALLMLNAWIQLICNQSFMSINLTQNKGLHFLVIFFCLQLYGDRGWSCKDSHANSLLP